MPATASRPYDPTDQSLRALGLRHGLHIGTAVDMAALNDAADPQYRALAASQFSTVTAENVDEVGEPRAHPGHLQLGARPTSSSSSPSSNQQIVRGHVLVWHNQLPAWLTAGVADGTISKTSCASCCSKHITDVVTHFKGKIWQWDVVNEAVSDPWDTPSTLHYKGFWAQHLGPGYIADAFRWARAADPKALLFYNDYNIEAFGSGDPADDKTQFVYDMAKQPARPGRPDRRRRQPGPPGHPVRQLRRPPGGRRAEAVHRARRLATAFTEVDVRSQLTAGVQAGDSDEINPRLQASAANYSVLMQACLADAAAACRTRSGVSPTSTPGCPAGSTTRRRAWPPSTTRTTSPSGRTTS